MRTLTFGTMMFSKLIITFGFLQLSSSLTVTEEPEIVVSRGAIIEEVHDVFLYTEEDSLNFLIPDLPDLPDLSKKSCTPNVSPEVCKVSGAISDINHESISILNLLSKYLTKNGLADVYEESGVNDANLDVEEEDTSQRESEINLPVSQKLPRGWLTEMKHKIARRKFVLGNDTQALIGRNRRFIAELVAAGGAEILSFVKRLFVDNDIILKFMSTLKALLPGSRKVFADISKRYSEFEVETKKRFVQVYNDTNTIRNIVEVLKDKARQHQIDLSDMQVGITSLEEIVGDTAAILYSSILFLLQISAFQDCRSGNIPMLFVPLKSLRDSLKDLEERLDPSIAFAIRNDRIQSYYVLPNRAKCIYDDNGGLLQARIPLIPKASAYALYKVRPIEYGLDDKTCFLNLEATYAVKDKNTGFVYSVTQVDADLCAPNRDNMCKVPQSTSDDISQTCVALLLAGATSSALKIGCELKCVKHAKTEVAKLRDDLFLITHPPSQGLEVVCPDERLDISRHVKYGTLRLLLKCDCLIMLNSKEVGRVTKKVCTPSDVISIDTQIPLHFTRLNSYTPFTDESVESITKFKHIDEILNENFEEEILTTKNEGVLTSQVPIVTLAWNSLQTIFLAYAYFKMHYLGASMLTFANHFPLAEAIESQYTCRLPNDSYYLLIAILCFAALGVIPSLVFCVYSAVRKLFWKTVEAEAQRLNTGNEVL